METSDTHKQNILFDLIEQGALDQALELLTGDSLFSKDELNKSLMLACQHGNKLLAQMLIGREAEVNYRDTNGNTPLLVSVQNGFTDIVQFLLTNNADVNASNFVGDSALILSIGSSLPREITENMLKQTGINIDHQNQDGYTAIMKAVEVKDIDKLRILLDFYNNLNDPKTSPSVYKDLDEHKTPRQFSDSFSDDIPISDSFSDDISIPDSVSNEISISESVSDDISKWSILKQTVNCKGENVHQIAERCGMGNIFQLLQKHVDIKVSPLELAVRENDVKSFHFFLENHLIYSADKKNNLTVTLRQIFKTCNDKDNLDFSENEISMIKALLENGAYVNTEWYDNESDPSSEDSSYESTLMNPIEIAAKSGCFQVLELLLSFQAEINHLNFLYSPLHTALSYGHTECAKLLIQHGATIDFIQALESAVYQQELKYVRFLMDNYKHEIMENLKGSSKIDEILSISVDGCILEIIGCILDLGANINGVIRSSIFMLDYSLHLGLDYSQYNLCPLAKSSNGEVAKFLIDRGANVNPVTDENINTTPLMMILYNRNTAYNSVVEVVKVLLENGASINETVHRGNTPLMLAGRKEGSMNVLQLLLDHGAELGAVDEEGNTALIHAARTGCSQNISFLLQFIKDRKELLNLQNCQGLTALMYAVRWITPITVEELINQGADVNIKDQNGKTALLYVFRVNDDEDKVITSLIQAGCDVNWQNNKGRSPLMVAARNYLKHAMCVLLDSGAEINAVSKTENSTTALTYLHDKHTDAFFSCLEFLLDRGASSSYMAANKLHQIIADDKIDIVPKIIRCGLGPVDVLGKKVSFSYYKNRKNNTEYYSPLCTALYSGNNSLARFFVRNLFLTQSDISSWYQKLLRQHLNNMTWEVGLDILNEISAQPMSLFNLSFVAVTTAVGTSPGREIRVKELPLPELIKDKLLFKSQDTELTLSEDEEDSVHDNVDDSVDESD